MSALLDALSPVFVYSALAFVLLVVAGRVHLRVCHVEHSSHPLWPPASPSGLDDSPEAVARRLEISAAEASSCVLASLFDTAALLAGVVAFFAAMATLAVIVGRVVLSVVS